MTASTIGRPRLAGLALAAAALTACTADRHVLVSAATIHAHLGELRSRGAATVEVDYEVDGKLSKATELVTFDQEVEVGGKRKSLADLGYTCADTPPAADAPVPAVNQCELLARRADPFLLRTDPGKFSAYQAGGVVIAGAALGGFFGAIGCAAECRSPYNTISIVALTALVVGGLVACAHNPSCHD